MNQSGDSTHISQRLEVGRQVLEGLANIAAKLEYAKEGLARSADLSSNLEELPPSIKRLWESLDKEILAMSGEEIDRKLQHLEQKLTERLTALMPLIEKVCAADDRGEEIKIEGFRSQFNDLARMASTSLAIRLFAQRKQYPLPPSRLPISAEALRARAQQVKGVERKHKLRVISHMREMVTATTDMLALPNLDGATRTMLQSVLSDLKANARHLANGGAFGSLPHPIETVELGEEEQEAAELSLVEDPLPKESIQTQPMEAQRPTTSAPPKPIAPESPKPTPAKVAVPDSVAAPLPAPRKSAVTRHPPRNSPAIRHPPVIRNPVVRLWKHLRVWMKAPLGVTWSEAALLMHDDDDF